MYVLENLLSQSLWGHFKSYTIYYKERGFPSLLSVVIVVTKGSTDVGVASVGALTWELPHFWEQFGGLTSKGEDLSLDV